MQELVNDVCLWTRFKQMDTTEVDNTAQKTAEEISEPEKKFEHVSNDLLWLLDLWFSQLILLLEQIPGSWYCSREFFIMLIRQHHTIGWKLIQDGFKAFEVAKSPWAKLQLFLLFGEACCHLDSPVINILLTNVAKLIIGPLNEMLFTPINPSKKTQCVKRCSLFLRKLNHLEIYDEFTNQIETLLSKASNSWKMEKNEKKQEKKNAKKNKKKSAKKNNQNKEKKTNENNSKKTNQNNSKKTNQSNGSVKKTTQNNANKTKIPSVKKTKIPSGKKSKIPSAKKTKIPSAKKTKIPSAKKTKIPSAKKTKQKKKRTFSTFNASPKNKKYGPPQKKRKMADDAKFV